MSSGCDHGGFTFDSGDVYPVCSDCGVALTVVPVAQLTDWVNVRMQINALFDAERKVLLDRSLTRQERLAHKVARDTYQMALDIMDESGIS